MCSENPAMPNRNIFKHLTKLIFDDIIIYPWGCPGFDRQMDGLVSIPKARLRKNGNLKLNAKQNQQIAYAA